MPRITPQEASERLRPRSGQRRAKGALPPLAYIRAHGDAAAPSLYEFCETDGRRILTPADSDLPVIIAYCERGGDMPPAFQSWLTDYDQEITWWQAQGKDLDLGLDLGAMVISEEKTIGPLIKCHWHQNAPYNQATVFEGKVCMTGCGATVIAQLLFYWGCQPHDGKYYRRGCMPIPPYTSKTNRYKVAALPNIALFDYDNFTVGKPSTDAQKKAVAEMMLYCGCAVKSDYAQGVTTSYLQDLQKGLRDYLRMGNPTIVQSSKGAAAFERAILAELKEGRPVLLIGSGSQGGHFFLCDGYDPATNLYHFNWGWGGSYDGWFAMSALNPSKYSFNSSKKAIIGIEPQYVWGDVNGDGVVTDADAMAVQKQILKGGKTEAADVNNDGEVDVADMMTIVKEVIENDK